MRVPIRLKLAMALSVPLVAMGIVTVIEVGSLARNASEIRDQTNLAAATVGPNGLITALQNERNWATAYMVGVQDQLRLEKVGFEATRADTDDALA